MGTVCVPDAEGTLNPAVGDGYWSDIPPPLHLPPDRGLIPCRDVSAPPVVR
jgi:hypothetical protein